MRPTLAVLAAGFIGFGFMTGSAHAEAIKVSPELTIFTEEPAASKNVGPTVLRGSATRRGTVRNSGRLDGYAGPIEIGAGSTLWLADPDTGEIIACEPRQTSHVGSRYVHCFDGRSSY